MKMQSQSFGRTLTGVLEIGRRRFLIGLLLQVGIWAFCLAILAVIDLVIKEEPLISSIGLCGLFAVGTGCILTFLEGLNQFNIDLAVEISFGIPRRRALAVSWIVTLGSGAVTIALAALQEAIWFHGVTGGTGEAIVSNIPAWGWLCLVFLPGAASAFTMGILRRFGKTGGGGAVAGIYGTVPDPAAVGNYLPRYDECSGRGDAGLPAPGGVGGGCGRYAAFVPCQCGDYKPLTNSDHPRYNANRKERRPGRGRRSLFMAGGVPHVG